MVGRATNGDIRALPGVFESALPSTTSAELWRWLESDRVDIAPRPILVGLEAANDWMRGPMEVLARVAVGRLIATTDVPAHEAESQVHPLVARLEALLASVGCARLHRTRLVEVAADVVHGLFVSAWQRGA